MRRLTVLMGLAVLFTITLTAFSTPYSSGAEKNPTMGKEKTEKMERASGLNSEYEQMYDEAANQYNEKKFDDAVISLNQIISKYPDYIPAYKLRGLAYMDKGRITKSQLPIDYVKYNQSIYEYQKAVKDFTKIIQLDPNLDYPYFYRAVSYVELDYYGQPALDDLDKYIDDFNKGSIEAHYYRGLAHLQRGFLPEAAKDLRIVIEAQPERTEAYAAAMRAFETEDFFNDGVEYFGSLTKQYPKNALPWFYSGLAYVQKGDYEKALKDFDKALALRPDFVEAKLMRNEVKMNNSLISEAD